MSTPKAKLFSDFQSRIRLLTRDNLGWKTMTIVALALLLACNSGLSPDGGEYDSVSWYRLAIGCSDEGCETDSVRVFDGVRTEWNLSSGIVVLGPEDPVAGDTTNGPLARLELLIGATGTDGVVAIDGATLSTSEVRVGTSEEANPKLFTLTSQGGAEMGVAAINSNNIKRSDLVIIEMERVIVHQGDAPETILVGFKFNAVD